MSSELNETVSALFTRIQSGSPDAEERLYELVYEELRTMARAKMKREPNAHTLQTTALVNEAYLRLVSDERRDWKGRAYFFAAASEAMRRILVDRARRVRSKKRGGDRMRQPLRTSTPAPGTSPDIVALDEALSALEEIDSRKSAVVKMRYFVGLTGEEIAEILEISPRTVDNDWRVARAWLKREISADLPGEAPNES